MRWLTAVFVLFLFSAQAAFAGDEVKLKKTFINGVAGDEAVLRVTSPSDGTDTHSAIGDGISPDIVGGDAKRDAVNGETVTISETLTGSNTGNYTANLTCDHSASTLNYTPGALTATIVYDDSDGQINCMFTNTLIGDNVILRKEWRNAVGGDSVTLDIDGVNDDSALSTATGVPGSEISGSFAQVEIVAGETITFTETDPNMAPNMGNYVVDFECDGATNTPVMVNALEYTLLIDAADEAIVCTFTNTDPIVRLRKAWADATGGDEAILDITDGVNSDNNTSTAIGGPAIQVDDANGVEIIPLAGNTVTFTETLPGTNSGSYATHFTCTGNTNQPVYTPGTTTATLLIDPADVFVQCTFQNAPSQLILRKVVSGAASPADWELSAWHDPDVPPVADADTFGFAAIPSIVNGPGDMSTVPQPVASGTAYALGETSVANGEYLDGYTAQTDFSTFTYWGCVDQTNTPVPVSFPGQTVTVAAGSTVTCTITNADSPIAPFFFPAPDPNLPGAAANIEFLDSGSLIIPMGSLRQNIDDTDPDDFNLTAYGLVNRLMQNNIPIKWAISATKPKVVGVATGGSAVSLVDTSRNFNALGVQVGDLVTVVGNGNIRKVVTGVAGNTLSLSSIDGGAIGNGDEYVVDGQDFAASATRVRGPATSITLPNTFHGSAFIVSAEYPIQLGWARVVMGLDPYNAVTDPPSLNGPNVLFDDNASQLAVRVYELSTDNTPIDIRYTLTHKTFAAVSDFNTGIHSAVLTNAGIPGALACTPPGNPGYDPNTCNWNQVNPVDLSNIECSTIHLEPHRDADPPAPATRAQVIQAVQEFVAGGGNFMAQCHATEYFENRDVRINANQNVVGQFLTTLGIDENGELGGDFQFPQSPMAFNQMTGNLDDTGGSVGAFRLPNGGTFKNNGYISSRYNADPNVLKAAAGKFATGAGVGGNVFYLGGHSYGSGSLDDINGQRMMLNTLFVPPDRPFACGLNVNAQLTIVKEVVNDDGGTGVADDFNITTTVGNPTFGAGVEAPAGTFTYTSDPIVFIPTGADVTLMEDDLQFYSEGTWECVDDADGVTVVGGGAYNAGTFTPQVGQAVTCTISNDDSQSALTLRKEWVNGVLNDTATIAIDGFVDDNALSTSSGVVGSEIDNVNTAMTFAATGETVTFAEAFGANSGSYATSFACTGNTNPVTYTPGALTATLLIDENDSNVVCTFTNSLSNTDITLRKEWVNGVLNDTALLSIDGVNDDTDTSTSTGAAGSEIDNTNTANTSATAGETITFSETLAGNTGLYTTGFACTGATNAPTYTPGATTATLLLDAADTNVVCTFTNTLQTSALTLRKEWINGVNGDTSSLTIDGFNDDTDLSTSSGAVGSEIDNANTANTTALAGQTVNLLELLGGGNTGSYDISFACTGATNAPTYTPGAASAMLLIDPADSNIVCTFTNTVRTASLTLRKAWVDALANDTAGLNIVGHDTDTSTASGAAGTEIDNTNTAVATVLVGEGVVMIETLGGGNTGQYTPSFACTGATNAPAYTPGDTGASLLIDPADQNANIVCTFTNTIQSANLTLRKAWVDGFNGDQATLNIFGIQNDADISASTGAAGTEIDVANTANTVAYAGETVQLDELLDGGNAGSYATTFACTGAANAPTYTPGATTATLLIDAADSNVVCTYTNTIQSASITLRKAWVDAVANDTADLTITALTPGNNTSTASGAAGTETDNTNTATTTALVGETITLSEALGGGNTGQYATSFACTGAANAPTYTPGATSATLLIDAADTDVVCTYTNTIQSAGVTLRKAWVDAVANDTADLTITALTPGNNTSTASGAAGTETDNTNTATTTALAGETITLSELLGGGNTGQYTTSFACTGATNSPTYTPGATSATLLIDAADSNVVCTYTNTIQSSGVILRKAWVDAVANDTAGLTITALTPGNNTSTASGAAGTETDNTNTATTTALAGETITLSELLGGGNTGQYSTSFACTGATNSPTYAPGTTTATLLIDAADSNIVCTYTNTIQSSGVILRKAWVDALANDTAGLSITALTPGNNTSTASGAAGTETDNTNTATTTALAGETITLSEVLGGGNTGQYTTSFACTGAANSPTYAPGATSATLLIDAADSNIVCTYTNTIQSANLTLRKAWVNGFAGDQANLNIFGIQNDADISVSSGAAGTETDVANTANTVAYVGETVQLDELLDGGNAGQYTTSFACTGAANAPTYTPGTTTATLLIDAADSNVVCTYTNTIVSSSVTLRKAWVDAESGDQVGLTITALTPGNNTSTASGAAGTETDNVNTATTTALAGETITLSEAFGGGNAASYTTSFACTGAANAPTYTPGTTSATLLIDAADTDVVCTFTNSVQTPSIDLDKTGSLSLGGDGVATPGDLITYTFTVTNDGNVTLTNISVTDPLVGLSAIDCSGDDTPPQIASLAPAASAMCTATYALTPADIAAGVVDNLATATGECAALGCPVNDTDPHSEPIPTIDIDKSGSFDPGMDGIATPGDIVTYTLTVTNTGMVELTNVNITDPLVTDPPNSGTIMCPAPGNGNITLAPAAVVVCTATYAITQDDIDTGNVFNTATVTGDCAVLGANCATDNDPFQFPTPRAGDIVINKTGALDLGGDGVATVGDIINYSMNVVNSGNVTLTNVTVTDPLITNPPNSGTITCPAPGNGAITLAPGTNVICTATYAITQADIDAGIVSNVATATGDCLMLTPCTTDDDDHDEPIPTIDIDKTGSLDLGGDGIATVGDLITYTLTVTNTGGVTLSNVEVTDPLITNPPNSGTITCPAPGNGAITLAPDAVVVCTATYALTMADIAAGQVQNTATVTGDCPGPLPDCATDTDPHDEPIPSVNLDKTGSLDLGGDGVATVGDVITYTFTVTNTGMVTLTDLEITDPLVGLSAIDCSGDDTPPQIATLAPAASAVCTATYMLTMADIAAGQVQNTATVTGDCPGPLPDCVTDDDPHDEPIPSVNLDKTGSLDLGGDGVATVGDVITYTFTVTNTGMVTLTNVLVSDPLMGLSPITCTAPETNPIADLAPAESVVCTATYALTMADIAAGQVQNTATVTGDCPGPLPNCVTDDDPHDEPIPTIDIDKTGSLDLGGDGVATPGDLISYTLTVTNTGEVTLSNVEVTDPLITDPPNSGTITCPAPGNGNITLAPDAMVVCTATYAITQADIDAGNVMNTATATGDCPGPLPNCVTDDDPHDEPVPQGPAIQIVKTADPQYYSMVGEVITYSFEVTNTGNITLDPVVVTDPLITDPPNSGTIDCGGGSNTFGPLAPNDPPVTCTAMYTITMADIGNPTVPNTATATGACTVDQSCPVNDTDDEVIERVDIDLSKTIIGLPALEGDGSYTVTYVIIATNLNQMGAGTYDLVDTFNLGNGITLNSATIAYQFGVGENDQSGTLQAPGTFPLPFVSGDTVVTGEGLAGGQSEQWLVTANFNIDIGTIDPVTSDCDPRPGTPVAGTGFYNQVAGSDTDPIPTNNQDCDGLPDPDIDLEKAVNGPAVLENDGTYTVSYTVTALNIGQGAGFYNLVDTFSPGDGITLNTATIDYQFGVGEDNQSGTLQAPGTLPLPFMSGDTVVTNEALAAGQFEQWVIVANFLVDPTEVMPATSGCDPRPGDPVPGTGFYNLIAGVDTDPTPGNNEDCTGLPDPDIDLEKTVNGPAVLQMDNSFTVTYTITATNLGNGPGMYNLVDTFTLGDGITLNSAEIDYQVGVGEDDQSGTLQAPMTLPLPFMSGDTVVTGEALAAQQFEQWVVTANFLIDPTMVDPGTASCDPRPGDPVPGTGFYNAIAGVDTDPNPGNNEDCTGLPIIDLMKTVNGPPVYNQGLDRWVVNYTITATNLSADPGEYNVLDNFSPGAGIMLDTGLTTATYQGGSPGEMQTGTPGAFPAGTVIVSSESLGAGLNESWLVEAYFTVDPGQTDPGSSGCTPRPGAPGINTGFYNAVAGSPVDPDPTNNEDCEGLPAIDLEKTVNGPAVYNEGLDRWVVNYTITATNTSGTLGMYDVLDTFAPGMGIMLDTVLTTATYQIGTDPTLSTGTPGAFPADTVIVTGESLGAGLNESWLVEAYFTVVPGDTDPGTSGCTPRPGAPGANTGFYNSVAGSPIDPDPTNNEDCEGLPIIDLEKTVNGPATYNDGLGLWLVEYTITATNTSSNTGMYDVIDVFAPGMGIMLDTANTMAVYQGGEPDGSTGTPGAFPNDTVIVTGETLDGGESESWLVSAYFSVDPGQADPGTSGCTPRPGAPGANTGFYNSVAGSPVDPDPTNNEDCEGLPIIDLEKTVNGPATYNDGLGLWLVEYTITATNTSSNTGMYDVVDVFATGMGITLDTANTMAVYQGGEPDGSTGTPGAFPNDDVIVTGEELDAGESESWLVSAYFSVVPGDVDPGTAGCEPRPGTPGAGTGFYNSVAGSPVDPDPTNNEDCEGLPVIDLDKTVNGPATYDDGLGLWLVEYTITATNSSSSSGMYDVLDDFDPGMGITLDTANTTATYQGGTMSEMQTGTPGAFPTDNVIVTGESLVGGASESWLVSAYFDVVPGDVDPGTAGCDPRPGTPGAGTGFYNSVAGSPTDPDPTNNEDCEGLPVIDLEKTVNGPATYDDGLGLWLVEYTITATNESSNTGTYDVIDVFDPGMGITLDTANTTATYQGGEPDGSTGTPGAFPNDDVIVTGEELDAGESESWLVSAYFSVVPGDVDPGNAGCEPRPGTPGAGTGFYNSVAGSPVDPDPTNNEDCEGLPIIDLDKTVQGPATYNDGLGLWQVNYLITATNTSTTTGQYDVIDVFDTGMGITLDTTNTMATYQGGEPDGSTGTPGAFPNDDVIVTGEELDGGESESWLVEAYFMVDPGMTDPGTSGCDPRPGTPGAGTGFYNSVAGSPVDPDPTNDEDCEGLPLVSLDKTVNGPAVYDEGTDRWIVEYTVTATNPSTTAGTYDVIDVFDPGMGIMMDPALTTATYVPIDDPDGTTGTPGAFPTDTVIVTDEGLGGGFSESWLIEAYFEVDLGTVDPGTSECEPRPGTPGAGTGFYNSVTGSDSDPDPVDNEDCTGLPEPILDLRKEALELVDNGGGSITVTYRITAENEGEGPALYDLIDTLDPGSGINIVTAQLTSYNAGSEDDQSGTLAGPLPYTFTSGETLVTDEELGPGHDESWTVVVDFQIDNEDVGPDFECNGGPGSGTYNRVDGSDTDPDPGNNDDCLDPPRLSTSFLVTKDFSDDNPMNVTVALSCNTGLPLYQEAELGEFANPFDVIEFIIGDFEPGTMNCEIFEVVPEGYLPTYTAGATTGIADDIYETEGGPDGCFYDGIEGGQFTCDIYNELQPVEVVVEKEWIDDHPEYINQTWVEITLQCDGPIEYGYPCLEARGDDNAYCIDTYIDPNNPGIFEVLPHYEGTTCFATEEPIPGVDTDQSDCAEMIVFPGQGDSCVIINTRLYVGIPTLSQYGLLLLALMMFGMGAVAYRRFI